MEQPHRRYNPLTESWVLVSPHRNNRPWLGQQEEVSIEANASYDPSCYLCPGNIRSNGTVNPAYQGAYSFVNDFAALLPQSNGSVVHTTSELLRAEMESGVCKVVCFSPDHSKDMAHMELSEVRGVVDLWVEEYLTLGAMPMIRYVQIFENKGSVMGCSNPHPHGQIWASTFMPDEPFKKHKTQNAYFDKHKRTLLQDYLEVELREQVRIVFENDFFVCLVPFWAVWPFETMILPKRPMSSIAAMEMKERDSFAHAYKTIARTYDALFNVPFPYSAGIHQAPTDGLVHEAWHWHLVFLPPLLRSATIKKFMVGYE
ncbi:MAG TPA: UDP-glucose--hexose-1-phosphate uridylyltransferase, partial [Cytophagales bacterium]|nr:UDP-glucose--hexose-1-phosphate uridylyltransferase [Cytophagales bacterium]